jgi:hypothetical protein
MRQPDPDSDEHLFSRLRRIEAAVFAAASRGDRRLLLVLQNDLRALLETLKQRCGQLAVKINRAGAQSSAARAYARCATLGTGALRKIIKARSN